MVNSGSFFTTFKSGFLGGLFINNNLPVKDNHYYACNLLAVVYIGLCKQLKINSSKIKSIEKIPFLPISFFKSHKVLSSQKKIKKTFISSGTSGTKSYHHITDLNLYEKSIRSCFNRFYGPKD